MPFPSTVQAPVAEWDVDFTYPNPPGGSVVPFTLLTARTEFLGPAAGWLWSQTSHVRMSDVGASAAGGYTAMATIWNAANSGLAYFGKGGSGNYSRNMINGMRAPIPVVGASTFAAGATLPSVCRVWILSALVKFLPGPSLGDNRSGLIIAPDVGGGNITWPTELAGAANKGGFGIVADGAGQWHIASFNRAGPSVLRFTQALPAHTFTSYNLVEFQIIADRAGIPATLEIWWNGALQGTWNWGGADLEPPAGFEWCYTPAVGVGPSCDIGYQLRVRRGRFTIQGIEITG